MTKTYSDFTDSFRILSSISSVNLNQDILPILKSYMDICAPLEIIKKLNQSEEKYSPEDILKIKQISEKRPDLLFLLGMNNPDEAKKVLEEY